MVSLYYVIVLVGKMPCNLGIHGTENINTLSYMFIEHCEPYASC